MIFNLFKSKPALKELIPDGFVDIHSHILPAIDDGARDLNDSIKLIEEMKKLGYSKIIGTPHTYPGLYNNTNETIIESFNKLIDYKKTDIQIEYASEYLIDESLIQKSKDKDILCLKNKHILVEMSYLGKPNNLYEILFQLRINGYTPILAHPERYSFLEENFNEFYKLKKQGCKFQLNLFSLTNHYGNSAYKTAIKLIQKNLIDFCGTDIHSAKQIKLFDNKIEASTSKKLEKIFINTLMFN